MSQGRGIGGHHHPYSGASDDWLTPKPIIDNLGPFDLDPCASYQQPWRSARIMYAPPKNGLALPWKGMVWCNPPYGPQTWEWLERLAEHGEGIALTFARTETRGFFAEVWGKASALLFIEKRLYFHYPITGERASSNSGGPSVLIAYGEKATGRLADSDIEGSFVWDWAL